MTNHGAKALAMAVSLLLGQASVVAAHPDKQLASVARPAAIIGGDTNAIIGGDRRKAKQPSAIIGGDTNAIIGGDTNAIIGGDRRKAKQPSAIIGGDTNAIIGGDRRKAKQPSAIIGGDTNAIIGGDTNAIIGGDRRKAKQPSAIIGGDTNAIIGGDRRKAKQPSAIIGGDMTGRQQRRIITRGPVDQVDTSTGRVEVLGQEFVTPRSTNLLQELSVRIASGEIVTATVYGSLRANGMPYPKSIVFSEDQQIPGVTIVTVLGMVQKIDHAHATLVIGGLTVDYTPLLADVPADFSAGTVVEVSGVRFSANGPLLASALQAH